MQDFSPTRRTAGFRRVASISLQSLTPYTFAGRDALARATRAARASDARGAPERRARRIRAVREAEPGGAGKAAAVACPPPVSLRAA